MATKKDDIVVNATKPTSDSGLGIQNLDYRLPRMDSGNRSLVGSGGGGGGGGGGGSRAATPAPKVNFGKVNTVAGPVYGAKYSGENFDVGAGLGRGLIGKAGAPIAGVTGNFRFKKGGKAKKMAKGGSTASKRADGCATKGKTKGKFV